MKSAIARDSGLLLQRLAFGLMLALGHGWGKVQQYSELSGKFPDPLGIGSQWSLMGAIGCEFVAALLVAVGLLTRFGAAAVAFNMSVAAFVIHTNDPLFMTGAGNSKEPALLYLAGFLPLVFTGPGAFSIDGMIWRRRRPVAIEISNPETAIRREP